MAVFISHSFADKDQFDNIADALDRNHVAYWRPGEMMPGAPLSDQLRDAIMRSELCIFIATKHSVDSGWCGAELGAFWGAGKRVLIYVADSSLKDEKLPRQFQGHFLERRISKIVEATEVYLSETTAPAPPIPGDVGGSSVGILKEDVQQLIESALDRMQTRSLTTTTMKHLAARLSSLPQEPITDAERTALQSSLYSLLGLPRTALEDAAPADWPHRVSPFSTTTGQWEGYAQREDWQSYNAILTPCLLVRYDERKCVAAAAILPRVVELDRGGTGVSEPIALAGRGKLGEVKQ